MSLFEKLLSVDLSQILDRLLFLFLLGEDLQSAMLEDESSQDTLSFSDIKVEQLSPADQFEVSSIGESHVPVLSRYYISALAELLREILIRVNQEMLCKSFDGFQSLYFIVHEVYGIC